MSRITLLQTKFHHGASILFAGLAALLLYYAFRPGRPDPGTTKLLTDLSDIQAKDEEEKKKKLQEEEEEPMEESTKSRGLPSIPSSPVKSKDTAGTSSTPISSNISSKIKESATKRDGKAVKEDVLEGVHKQIEAIDKRGKKLFKEKKFLDAAEVFTEALDFIESTKKDESVVKACGNLDGNFDRQIWTLTNNRSAMYEKGQLPDLALHDCDTILQLDATHTKARTRKLRILESQKRYTEALVEVCALQLNFMQENRDKLRMGIPVEPPVQQSKIEELMGHILPEEIERQLGIIREKYGEDAQRPLPSQHTIVQLMQSFTGYNAWMATAALDGSLDNLTAQLDALESETEGVLEKKVEILLRRGRRYAYHRKFDTACEDFEAALKICEENEGLKDLLEGDTYARVLEWVGMSRHFHYNLEGAIKCYEECADLEPTNAEILVKCAGVKMDAGKLDEALPLFDSALGLDPSAADALLHRANLRVIEQKPAEAKVDLDQCLKLRPDYVLAHLRLATVLMATNDLDGAKKCLDEAERIDPQSSEVHSYRGELLFASSEFVEAHAEFDRAIECDAGNPTPYVNAALAVMNTPTANGGPPDIPKAVQLLEKAIEVDPQFHAAYVHLGQLKLSMATDLSIAREVVALYDKGLDNCRTADELKDIVSMRILTVAQVDAASFMKMDTLNMQ